MQAQVVRDSAAAFCEERFDDPEVLAFAIRERRAIVTLNRLHFS